MKDFFCGILFIFCLEFLAFWVWIYVAYKTPRKS
jgi:hypothetical protein